MADYLAEYNFEGYAPFLIGDTFEELEFEVLVEDPDTHVITPLDLTNVDIFWQFRKNDKDGELFWDLSVGAGLTKTNPAAGKFKIDQIDVINLTEGIYYHDCEFLNTVTSIKLTYYGGTVEAVKTVTKV